MAISALASMLRPLMITLRPAARAMSTIIWMRPMLEAKSATMMRPVLWATICARVSPTRLSGMVEPSRSMLVESESNARTPRSPQRANLPTSVPLSPSLRLILKSRCARSGLRACRWRPRPVDHAMAYPDEIQLKGAQPQRLGRGYDVQAGRGAHLLFGQLLPNESQGEGRPEDWDVDLPQQKSKAPMWSSWAWVSTMPWMRDLFSGCRTGRE